MTEPFKPDETGTRRDERGRFAVGTAPGPGRPKAVDLRAVAQKAAKENGTTIEAELGKVVLALAEKARDGDVGAARLLFEKLSLDDSKPLAIAIDARTEHTGPRPPADPVAFSDWLVDLAHTAETLAPDRHRPGRIEVQPIADDEADDLAPPPVAGYLTAEDDDREPAPPTWTGHDL